jgi:transcription elongation factor GreB
VSRYRPPQPRSSPYITPEGAETLREELRRLWKEERPRVTAAVHEAAKNGDRSENGDYIYGKRRLREIDRRVRYLKKRLDEIQIIERAPPDQSRVYFGAWVTLEDEDGIANTWRIVGADEIDSAKGCISIDSPVARKAVGREVDDEFEIRVGDGHKCYVITDIRYG